MGAGCEADLHHHSLPLADDVFGLTNKAICIPPDMFYRLYSSMRREHKVADAYTM